MVKNHLILDLLTKTAMKIKNYMIILIVYVILTIYNGKISNKYFVKGGEALLWKNKNEDSSINVKDIHRSFVEKHADEDLLFRCEFEVKLIFFVLYLCIKHLYLCMFSLCFCITNYLVVVSSLPVMKKIFFKLFELTQIKNIDLKKTL